MICETTENSMNGTKVWTYKILCFVHGLLFGLTYLWLHKAMPTSNTKMPLSENRTQRCLPLSHGSLAYWVTLFQIVHNYILVVRGPTIRDMCHLPFERKELENRGHCLPKTAPQARPGNACLLSQIMGRPRQKDYTFQAPLDYKMSSH